MSPSAVRPMLALTLWPEWAWAVCNLGKRVENRLWKPSERQLAPGEVFAIHAGKHWGGRAGVAATEDGLYAVAEALLAAEPHAMVEVVNARGRRAPYLLARTSRGRHHLDPKAAPTGSVVALATYLGAMSSNAGRRQAWASMAPDTWHWMLGDLPGWGVLTLPEPVSCTGHQGLWRLPRGVAREVRRQLVGAGVSVPANLDAACRWSAAC